MHLYKIIQEFPFLELRGNKNIKISGVCSNSRCIGYGNLFVAKKGLTTDGSIFIPEAINAGAVAILTDVYDPSYKNVAQLITDNVEHAEASISRFFYGNPSEQLLMVGVTGTNGKTTTAYLIKYILDSLRGPTGLIGTVEYITGERHLPATHTTPDVTINQRLLHEMVKAKCQSAVMEVTSHALTQGRCAEIHFDVGVFTNLSQDHLDYHKTMESYAEAKSLLFKGMNPKDKGSDKHKSIIVNHDDPYTKIITKNCDVPTLSYGIDKDADLSASNIRFSQKGTSFCVSYQNRDYDCEVPIVGRYNIYNALAAIGVALSQGFPLEAIIEKISMVPTVPGRMELVDNPLGLRILVDFAHTDDALKNALACLKEMKHQRIITVFGCGGDRDSGKRPKMAKVSGQWSDISIVTSDNPRSEDPMAIIGEVVAGFGEGDKYIVEADRKLAIDKAIQLATTEDIVLIAGKGHETTQLCSHHRIDFDDRSVALECCIQAHSKLVTS